MKREEREDYVDLLVALTRWFESQGIKPREAAKICSMAAGQLIGTLSTDKPHLEEGIWAARMTIEIIAHIYFSKTRSTDKNE